MKRTEVAQMMLKVGWLALVVSMPMLFDYYPKYTWNQQIIYQSTWTMIYEQICTPDRAGLLIPCFFSLAVATLATLVPPRFAGKWLIWNCRIIVAAWICVMGLAFGLSILLSNFVIIKYGIGCPFFCIGGLLICVSAWIRPVMKNASN